ncbi:MAG TPA: hypothetical protein VK563_04670 [Puia sp.]|nr:hypothetical protein [Puia sp.]
MNAAIDFERSIRHERLIYLGTPKQKRFLAFATHIQGIVLLVINLLVFFFILITGTELMAALTLIPILPILISMTVMTKLSKVEGTEIQRNQSEIFALLLRMCPGIQRHNCSQHITIITNEPKAFTMNKEIVVLLDDHHVYLNISTSRRRKNIRYILFAIPNYFRSRAILRNFCRRLEAQSYQSLRVVNA